MSRSRSRPPARVAAEAMLAAGEAGLPGPGAAEETVEEEAVRAAGEAELPRPGAAEEAAAEAAVAAGEAIAAGEAVPGGDDLGSQSSEELPDMEIIVRGMGNSFNALTVSPSETIGSLKATVWHILGIRLERQTLVCAPGIFLRPDTSTLQDHNICSGAVIHVVWPWGSWIRLFVRSRVSGGFHAITLHHDDTVKDFKDRIAILECLPRRQQRLTFSGRILENDHRLSDYATLVNGCTLILEMVNRAGEAVRAGGRG